jgi:ATP-dependent DNA helicase RecG
LTVLPGIGPKNAKVMSALNLNNLGDLLYYYPRRYDDYSKLEPISRLMYGETVTVVGTIQSIDSRPMRGGTTRVIEAVVGDGTGNLRVTWFNQPWLANKLKPGTPLALSGKVDQYLGRITMTSPEWDLIENQNLSTNRIVPVYPLTSGVSQQWLRRIIQPTVVYWASRIPDYLPDSIRESAGLMDLGTAIEEVHFPHSSPDLHAARERLAFDEIFFLQLGVLNQKMTWQQAEAQVFETDEDWLQSHLQTLPYPLTGAQTRALEEIRADLCSGKPMNRLLQGDVGSGKTVVAAMAVAMVVGHPAQAAIMAPTSILAEQLHRNLVNILCQQPEESAPLLLNHQVRLLIGDTPETEKEEIRAGLLDGSIKVVVGTHALLEGDVQFQRLQLVVVDEQHRFGVEQRAILRTKGDNPHLLVMTATPIPRSLALTVYGDLDLSVMDEMPAGRLAIETHLLYPRERERAYSMIKSQIELGYQAFIIYPLVEQGDRDDSRAAVEEHQRLQKEVFPKHRLGLLHGRLKPEEKEQVMARFRDGEYQVLVSTSVVEVGVDIPNATMMVIEGANRFGLAQLHQFRGRVGRGSVQSFCLLIPETEDGVDNARLNAMVETNDGFVLAERDLQQRGPGDFLGTRQSGFSDLKMASLTDVRLIEKARQQAQALFQIDPGLQDPAHQPLAIALKRFWIAGSGDIS